MAAASAPRALRPVPIAHTGSYAITRPAATIAPGSRPPSAPRSCSSTTPVSRPASRSASTSPTHRIGRSPPATARSSLRPMSSSVSPLEARRSGWPRITHVARPWSIPTETSPVNAPAASWWTFWAPTATSSAARASRTGARQTKGGQMTRVTPGSRVRDAIVRASSPASAGTVFIFQLAAITTGRIARSCQRRPPPGPAPDPLVIVEGEALHAVQRPLDRRAVEVEPGGDLGQGGLGRLAPRLRDRPHGPWLVAQPPVGLQGVDRRELAARRRDRPVQVGALGVDDAVEVAPQGPRDAPGLELQQRRAPADPAEERGDRLGALRGHDAAAAAHAPGGDEPDRVEPRRERRGLLRRHDELEVGAAGREAERAAGEEPAAEPGQAAVLGRRGPVEGRRRQREHPAGPAAARGRVAAQADGEAPDGRLAGAERRAEAGDLRLAVARARRVDRRELGAQRRDQVPVALRHRPRSGRPRGAVDARAAPAAALAGPDPDDRRGEPERVVVV